MPAPRFNRLGQHASCAAQNENGSFIQKTPAKTPPTSFTDGQGPTTVTLGNNGREQNWRTGLRQNSVERGPVAGLLPLNLFVIPGLYMTVGEGEVYALHAILDGMACASVDHIRIVVSFSQAKIRDYRLERRNRIFQLRRPSVFGSRGRSRGCGCGRHASILQGPRAHQQCQMMAKLPYWRTKNLFKSSMVINSWLLRCVRNHLAASAKSPGRVGQYHIGTVSP